MNISEKFLAQIDELQHKQIPESVMDRACRSLLDYLAVTCAGARFQNEKLNKYCSFAQPEKGNYLAVGIGKDFALKEAVFLNGLNGHALDLDDGTNSGIIHLGAPVFSLLIPLAQRENCSIEDILKAAIIGYEASYTVAVSIQPCHKIMGYHATGTCGVIGATLAASYLLGFPKSERFHAFATACISASGMLKVLDDGSELKPYNVAKTALLSLTSLQLAKAGFKGHENPFGGRGFLKMMTGRDDIELEPVLRNGTYAIMKSYTKPYASCRYTHPAVEAAINIRKMVPIEEIERIDIRTYELAVYGHNHTDVLGSASAKMSIPFAVAVGFVLGKASLQEFSEETIRNEEIVKLTKKIHVEADKELSEVFPKIQAAVVKVKTRKGSLVERVDYPKGEPENPLTEEEFKSRYDGLMAYGQIERDVSEKIYNMIKRRDTKIKSIVALL